MSRNAHDNKQERYKTLTSTDSPYTVLVGDEVIAADASSGAITVNLPALSTLSYLRLTVVKTDASVNAVTLDGAGAETINGSATYTLVAQYNSVTLFATPTGWQVTGSPTGSSSGALATPAPIPRPTASGYNAVLWSLATMNTLGTIAPLANQLICDLHYEEQVQDVYDSISFEQQGGAAAGRTSYMALYSVGTDGLPNALLWSSTSLDGTAIGQKNLAFSAGTWTSAGANYKNSSNQLVLSRGQAIYKAYWTNGVSAYSVPRAEAKSWIPWNTTSLLSGPVALSRTAGLVYPTFPDPFGTVVLLTSGSIPAMWLVTA